MKQLLSMIMLLISGFGVAENYKEIVKVEQNAKINFQGIVTCTSSDYLWGGSSPDGKKHDLKLTMSRNSTPLTNKIMIKKNDEKILMVDNEEFRIIKKNAQEIFAVLLDEMNAITVQLVSETGILIYSKAFSGYPIKNNFMGYVASCKNTVN